MTEQQAVEKYLSWWRDQIGYYEGENNWTKYAASADLAKLYGWKAQNQPWCDIVFDEGMIECFGLENASKMTYQSIGRGSALCRTSAQYYKDNGAWFTSPRPGDQVFFYDSARVINHTGVVEKVAGGLVQTIEGNKIDRVERCVYGQSVAIIAGFGRPKWSVIADEADDPGDGEVVVVDPGDERSDDDHDVYQLQFHVLRYGAGMGDQAFLREEVRSVQRILKSMGFDIGRHGLDGEFGIDTRLAVQKYQHSVGLNADGEVGPKTMSAMMGV